MERVFAAATADWRGLGVIPDSGLALSDEYAAFDAARASPWTRLPPVEHQGCRCGEVLRGVIEPPDCPLFGRPARRPPRRARAWSPPRAPAPPTTAIGEGCRSDQ